MSRSALARIRVVEKHATFRAPLSRPGADSRPETWAAETLDGIWRIERQEGERLLKWALVYRPLDRLVAYAPSLASCRRMITEGSWRLDDLDPTDGLWRELQRTGRPNPAKEFYRNRDGRREGPACVVVTWFLGGELHRGVFGDAETAVAWAQSGIEAQKRSTDAARAAR